MVRVTDEELLAHAERINDKVVLITGGGSGIGKHAALIFARYGAKVVIGDLNAAGAQAVADEITASGGSAIAQACNVTIWDEQVALFDLAVETYGTINVVVANAGVNDGSFMPVKGNDGKLSPPKLLTIDVNITGTCYTTSLAMHYLTLDPPASGGLKALIFTGSAASFKPIPGSILYTASKHAVLGIQRSIGPLCTAKGIRSGSVNPNFSDTPFIKIAAEKGLLSGFPLVPVDRIAATVLAVATNPDPETSERPWLLLDGGEVERLHDFDLDEGLYKELNRRIKSSMQPATPFVIPAKN